MTDDYTTKTETSAPSAEVGDSYAWTEPEPAAATSDAGAKAREWLTQLQAMIENLATQAGPVVKEVGAKAAELAALAGEKAGPVAQKAAEITGQAGQKLASKGRDLAAELRRDVATSKGETNVETAGDIAESTAEATSEEPTPTGAA
jgi:hypothetical protein